MLSLLFFLLYVKVYTGANCNKIIWDASIFAHQSNYNLKSESCRVRSVELSVWSEVYLLDALFFMIKRKCHFGFIGSIICFLLAPFSQKHIFSVLNFLKKKSANKKYKIYFCIALNVSNIMPVFIRSRKVSNITALFHYLDAMLIIWCPMDMMSTEMMFFFFH